jgi:DNA-binding transcriptional LysR family regulator
MAVTPRQIRSLLKVVELGSIRQASTQLHLAPSSISAQLNELASELDVELFRSTTRGLVLTDAGKRLMPQFVEFARLADDIQRAAVDVAGEPAGELKLYAPSSMCIYRLPAIISYLQQHAPKIELVLVHEPFDYLTALQAGELDAAIEVSIDEADPHFYSQPMYTEEVIFVCHPDRWQAQPLSLEALSSQPLITTEPACSYRREIARRFQQSSLVLQPRQSFSNVEVIRRCVLANMGIGVLPRCVVDADCRDGSLIQQAVADEPCLFTSRMIYPQRRAGSALLSTLDNAISEVCAA